MPYFYMQDEEIFAPKNSVLFNFWGGIMISASFSPGKQVLHPNYASFTGQISPKISYRLGHVGSADKVQLSSASVGSRIFIVLQLFYTYCVKLLFSFRGWKWQ